MRRRRLTAVSVLALLSVAALFGLMRILSGSGAVAAIALTPVASAAPTSAFRTPRPEEIRGVHPPGPHSSVPRKLQDSLPPRPHCLAQDRVAVQE